MSRAFVKEKDGDAPDDGLPERAASAEPNYVTPQGLADLKRRLADAQESQQRIGAAPDQPSKRSLAALKRDIRYLQHRIESAIIVETSAADEVQFGSSVTVDVDGKHMTYHIVGEDQADPKSGAISWTSPLGRALMGHKRGDAVVWPRPVGDVEVTVRDIR